jgi:eukaryotic-like serine/threonine-protein kinase
VLGQLTADFDNSTSVSGVAPLPWFPDQDDIMLSIGQVLQGRYHVVAVLGQGGMGAVYRAFDDRLNADCVVKEMLITPETLAHAADAAEQFKREAAVLAMLRHPNLPRVIDHFSERDSNYLVMDFIEGRNLHKMISAQGMPEAVVLTYAKQLLDVLEYIHAHGVVHRDIKPANIIIRSDGQAVLVDFGLVKLFTTTGSNTTKTFLRGVGTPEYAPPEQHTGGTDQRSDLYSLGGTLYQGLTGRAPVNAIDRASGLNMPGIREINPTVTARTEQVVLKAMSLHRDKRYPDAATMRSELMGTSSRDTARTSTARPSEVEKGGNTTQFEDKPKPKWIGALIAAALIVFALAIASFTLRGSLETNAPVEPPTAGVLQLEVTSTYTLLASNTAVQVQRALITPTMVAGVTQAQVSLTPTLESTITSIPPTITIELTNTSLPPTSAIESTKTPALPTKTPKPSSTPKPTNTPVPPTDTPIPPTDTPAVTNTPALTIDPCVPKWFFSPAPTNDGCPQNMRSLSASMQVYEKGRILWLNDPQLSQQVFVFYSNGTWTHIDGNIDSVGGSPDQVNLLGQPTGGRSNYMTCAAHSNVNGRVTSYINDAAGNIIGFSITADGSQTLGWKYESNARAIGCG